MTSCAPALPTARSGRRSGTAFRTWRRCSGERRRSIFRGPFAGLRVLELADETGQFCGKLLGDLGADVVKIEPPGGEPCRHVGPFLDDIPDPERSLSFWYYNTSKRGITLNLETADGRKLFRRLAAGADVIARNLPARASWRLSGWITSPCATELPG